MYYYIIYLTFSIHLDRNLTVWTFKNEISNILFSKCLFEQCPFELMSTATFLLSKCSWIKFSDQWKKRTRSFDFRLMCLFFHLADEIFIRANVHSSKCSFKKIVVRVNVIWSICIRAKVFEPKIFEKDYNLTEYPIYREENRKIVEIENIETEMVQ